jgi:concentrative nucleoside transporter, CNT family
MIPEDDGTSTANLVEDPEPVATSTTDAIVKGTTVGLELLLNIAAMLIVFVALVHLANAVLGLLPDLAGPITLQRVLGYVMAPLCWLIGVPWAEAVTAGALMGVKTILNEFLAYIQMASLPAEALRTCTRNNYFCVDADDRRSTVRRPSIMFEV